jgi:ankyrin repeat protein
MNLITVILFGYFLANTALSMDSVEDSEDESLPDKGIYFKAKLSEREDALFSSVIYGEVEKLNSLVAENAALNINLMGKGENTLLHFACQEGHFGVVKRLIELGATINVKNRKGVSPLSLACAYEKWDIVDYLMDHKADPNCNTAYDYVPLHFAASKNQLSLVRKMIEAGAEKAMTSGSLDFDSELHLACANGHLEMVRYFYSIGYKNLEDTNGLVPHFKSAVKNHRLDLVKYLLEEKAPFSVDSLPDISPRHPVDYEIFSLVLSYLNENNLIHDSEVYLIINKIFLCFNKLQGAKDTGLEELVKSVLLLNIDLLLSEEKIEGDQEVGFEVGFNIQRLKAYNEWIEELKFEICKDIKFTESFPVGEKRQYYSDENHSSSSKRFPDKVDL